MNSSSERSGCLLEAPASVSRCCAHPPNQLLPLPPTPPTPPPPTHPPCLQTFQLTAAAPLPPQLLPYLRVVHATRAEDVAVVQLGEGVTWQCSERALQVAPENELTALNQVRCVCPGGVWLTRARPRVHMRTCVLAWGSLPFNLGVVTMLRLRLLRRHSRNAPSTLVALSPSWLQLITVLRLRLSRYRTTIEEDEAVIADPTVKPRHAVAARLLRSEKVRMRLC